MEHSSHLNDAAKLKNQIVATLQSLARDCISINSKSGYSILAEQ